MGTRIGQLAMHLGLLAVLVLGWVATPATAEEPTARVVLVLDGSGSMWGQLDGTPKIQIARGVIRDLMQDWDPRIDLGLTAYGHRSRRDCKDIEALLPVAPVEAQSVIAAADALKPIGMTPIGDAVRHAADQLRYREEAATVVLVSDGQETCSQDPCAVARDLEAAGVDFTTHVIGFDVSATERSQLQCLAEATDGLYLAADDTASLLAALRTAIREVSERSDPLLWLSAALSPGTPEIGGNVQWRIERLERRSSRVRETTLEATSGTLTPRLLAGRYRITAAYEGVSTSIEIDYDPKDRQRHVLDLAAGQIEAAAVGANGQALSGDVVWTATRLDEKAAPRSARSASARLTLPAGRYRIEALHDGSRIADEVMLRPGRILDHEARFGRGRLALRASLAAGGQAIQQPIEWQVHAMQSADGPLGDLVFEGRSATALRSLPTGLYQISARLGDAVARSIAEVRSSLTTAHTVDLDAGTIRIFGSHPPPGGSIHDRIAWQIVALDRGKKKIAEREASSQELTLPAGRYRVSGKHGGLRGAADFVVTAGGETSVNVTFR